MASNQNIRQRFDDDVIEWIKENICREFHAENSGVMFFDEPQLPHTDVTRDYVLLYNLETGGANSELCFWREKSQDLRRERALAVERGSRLELIDRVNGPFDCWYMVNARVIHSVENVTGLRLNLQISFDTQLPLGILTSSQENTHEKTHRNPLGHCARSLESVYACC